MSDEKPEPVVTYKKDAAFVQRLNWVMKRISKDNIRAVDVAGMAQSHFDCTPEYARWLLRRAAPEVACEMILQARNPGEVARYIADGWDLGRMHSENVVREGFALASARCDMIDPWPVCMAAFLKAMTDKDATVQNKIAAGRALLEMSPRYQSMQKAGDLNVNIGLGVIQQLVAHVESGATTQVVDAQFIEQKVSEALKLVAPDKSITDETTDAHESNGKIVDHEEDE